MCIKNNEMLSHTSGSHVKPTTASLTLIDTITITASQNIQVYMESQNMNLQESKRNPKLFRSEMNN